VWRFNGSTFVYQLDGSRQEVTDGKEVGCPEVVLSYEGVYDVPDAPRAIEDTVEALCMQELVIMKLLPTGFSRFNRCLMVRRHLTMGFPCLTSGPLRFVASEKISVCVNTDLGPLCCQNCAAIWMPDVRHEDGIVMLRNPACPVCASSDIELVTDRMINRLPERRREVLLSAAFASYPSRIFFADELRGAWL
jgi:hypothetical protein